MLIDMLIEKASLTYVRRLVDQDDLLPFKFPLSAYGDSRRTRVPCCVAGNGRVVSRPDGQRTVIVKPLPDWGGRKNVTLADDCVR